MINYKIILFIFLVAFGPSRADDSSFFLSRAMILRKMGKPAEAISLCQKVVAADKDNFDAYSMLGKICLQQRKYKDAMAAFRVAKKLRPEDISIDVEMANILILCGQNKKAIEVLEEYKQKDDKNISVLYTLGSLYTSERRFDKSIELYTDLSNQYPQEPMISTMLALSYLYSGDLKKGFAVIEDRHRRHAQLPVVSIGKKWNGEDLEKKTLLIFGEWGVGDVFFLARYFMEVKNKNKKAKIIFRTHAPYIKKVLSLCPYIDLVIDEKEELPKFDYWLGMFSLPKIFDTTADSIPAKIPYLYARDDLVLQWKKVLSKTSKLKVGLCWNAGIGVVDPFKPDHGKSRSVDFSELKIISNSDILFYSLQKEQQKNIAFGKSTINCFGKDFDKSHGSFMDTAAVMKNLDLVITVDTSVANLAGALGIPVWILLPYHSDWRWLLNRDDSPWYPTAKLFRQSKDENWKSVLISVKKELEKLVKDEV